MGVETIDLMYIIFNHDLNVIHPYYYGEMSLNDIFENFYENRNISDFVFRQTEVENIETELGIDGKIPLSEFIRGKDLMERWEMNSDQIYMIMYHPGLEAIDPFGHQIGNDFLKALIESNTLYVWDLLFRLSDIEDLESEYDELEPKQPYQEKDSDPEKPEPIPESEQESIPIISFYKNGDKWLIGEKGKEKTFNHLAGFEFIRFLIRYEGGTFDPTKVYYCGIVPEEEQNELYGRDYQKLTDPKTVTLLIERKEDYQDRLKETFDMEEREKIEAEVDKCDTYLKKARQGFKSKMDNYRVNVQKRIKNAIDKINEKAKKSPSIRPLTKYLCLENPDKRIKTGYFIWYHQDPSDPVKWIIDPPNP